MSTIEIDCDDRACPGYGNGCKRTLVRPPLERYARTTKTVDEFTVEPAVEFRDGDAWRKLVSILDDIATASVMVLTRPDAVNLADSMAVCERIGDAISEVFPDRAYFVEVWQNGRRGFAQVFQPFGVPRNR